jgi:phosphatidylserine/phosphatidylglycerophosphate/cardiolipin synthase-like enzyme
MKRFLPIIILFTFLLTSCSLPIHAKPSTWSVFFSPKGGCTEAVINEIDKAQKSVYVLAHSFTSDTIAKALVSAHDRGVNVEIILDKSQRTAKSSLASFVEQSGIHTKIDAAHAIAHNKVMIIDGEVLITGSFDFTKVAEEKNAENLFIVRDKALAEKYFENWLVHFGHAEFYP